MAAIDNLNSMEGPEIEETPVLLVPRPQHQNPLKMLELLVKGFCPTTIVDRVDVNEEMRSRHAAPSFSLPKQQPTKAPRKSTSKAKPTTSKGAAKPMSARRVRTTPNSDASVTTEKPFEIGERPPSDVIGISKKLFEDFCYHPNAPPSPPHHKGFCSVLMDYRLCFNDDLPPDSEECSVSTASSSSVDLSPQSSPRSSVPQQSASYGDHLSFLSDDCEENELPLVEYQDKRSYRGTQVLIMTMLALYVTLALLRSMGHTSMHLALEKKHNHAAPRPITFTISNS